MKLNIEPRTIFCKDNLDILKGINSDCIDLIYLDPPFNKNKIFSAPLGTSAEGAEFSDIFREEDIKDEWVTGIRFQNITLHGYLSSLKKFTNQYTYCYLVYLSIRLLECYRILKNSGYIFLHCDSTMSHYLKVALDCIFDEKNFRNEIIWQRNDARGKGSQFKAKKFGSNTDTILFYGKTNKPSINVHQEVSLADPEIREKFHKTDERGELYYTGIPIFSSKSMGPRPNLCYEWKGFKNPHPSGWRLSKDRLNEEFEKGNVVITKKGKLERRKYLKDYLGKPYDNNWNNISPVKGNESTGYPTQKPVELLRRIIKSTTKKGDVVLDPFCGCATTCIAAEELERDWIGIDVSVKAYDLVRERLKKTVLPLFKGDPIFRTDIPTLSSDSLQSTKGFVYVMSNRVHKDMYKVGITKDVKRRLSTYQTSDPHRGFKIEFQIESPKYEEIEAKIIKKFNGDHEWIKGDLDNIISEIKKEAKN